MKTPSFLTKIKSRIAALFAVMLTSALCMASTPQITPQVGWHVDVTTVGSNVRFYAPSQIALKGGYVYTMVPAGFTEVFANIKQAATSYVVTLANSAGLVINADAPDLSAISTGFFTKGPETFRKQVNSWNLDKYGIRVYKRVKQPIKLPKLSAKGGPRPYRTNDDSSGNGFKFTDRELKVNQSKWDFTYNPEEFRNTYLQDESEQPEYQQALDQISKEYLAAINDSAMGSGTYNSSGTTAAAIATGYLTIIANEISGSAITPVVTGSISTSNAVTKVETLVSAMPAWMRERTDVKILCSYDVFDKYKTHYRASFGFTFQPSAIGKYIVDGTNIELVPCSWMGSSQRLIGTIDGNLVAGTDSDAISVHPSIKMDQIEVRLKMAVGLQIADLEALIVNDQA
jgi:hypothetical protein